MKRILLTFLSVFYLFSSAAFAREDVLVFAASSMTTALSQIVRDYEKQTGENVVVSYASSSALARQLAYGAPADIYISANEKWMDYAVDQGVIESAAVSPWVANQLVFVAPANGVNTLSLEPKGLLQAIGNSRIAVADPNHVPAGIYAKEALESLGLWSTVEEKLALSNSVRATLALVERGEALLGVVYYSDAKASGAVHVVAPIPDNSHAPIVFPKALTKEASESAKAFFRFLDSESAKQVLSANGFVVLTSKQEQ
ncbi:molybdate ABC transporter substrate-binding protein [Grimontia hollisae]|uniref:molybdate ABC transporter substrate-binding protein n=1 Tax=Grimontia hollisae TaxID=673 RepID=UPI001303A0DF|nr:molybdate ABC transporter substrate-binding protein [Grimontia hollisae]